MMGARRHIINEGYFGKKTLKSEVLILITINVENRCVA